MGRPRSSGYQQRKARILQARQKAHAQQAAAPVTACPEPALAPWRTDPALAAQVEETLSTLTIKRRRFLLGLIESGNARRSVLAAGYNCKSPKNATDVATQLLSDPTVQHAYRTLLDAPFSATPTYSHVTAARS